MRDKSSEAQSHAEYCIGGWIELYVSGRWSLAQFEAHLEAMLPVFRPDEWLPRQTRSDRRRTAKQSAEAWSMATTAKAANYTAALSARPWLGGNA